MNWTLLHKYLSDECSPAEMQQVEDWLQSDRENQRFMDSLEKIWEVEPADGLQVDAKSAWGSFQHKISDKEEMPRQKEPVFRVRKLRQPPVTPPTYRRSIAMALSAAAVILIAFLFSRYVPVVNEASPGESQLAMQEIVTTKGQRTTFRLSDGTRVHLNADSKIEIPAAFMDSTRTVHLEGEAYFEVTPNPDQPFLVQSGEAFTRVLGTKFGVRAYPGENQTQVVVTEGKVALGFEKQSADQDRKTITRNQIGILSKNGQMEVSTANNIQRYLGWKDGRLVFEDTSFREVKLHLERWFDITCTVSDSSLDNRRITASFNGEPMTEVLNVIALSMDMSYERVGREVTFQKN